MFRKYPASWRPFSRCGACGLGRPVGTSTAYSSVTGALGNSTSSSSNVKPCSRGTPFACLRRPIRARERSEAFPRPRARIFEESSIGYRASPGRTGRPSAAERLAASARALRVRAVLTFSGSDRPRKARSTHRPKGDGPSSDVWMVLHPVSPRRRIFRPPSGT